MRQSRSATDRTNLHCASSYSQLSLSEQTLINCANNSNKPQDDATNRLLPTIPSVPEHSATSLSSVDEHSTSIHLSPCEKTLVNCTNNSNKPHDDRSNGLLPTTSSVEEHSASSHCQLSPCDQTLTNCTNNSNKPQDDRADWLLPTIPSEAEHSTSSHSQMSPCEQTLINATNNSNKRHDEPPNWLLPTVSSAQKHPESRPRKPANRRAPGQRQALLAASELGGNSCRLASSSGCYVQNGTSSKNSVPTYVLKDSAVAASQAPGDGIDQFGPKRPFTHNRSEISPTSAQRQKSAATPARTSYQRQSHFSGDRVSGDQSAVARRNRSLEQRAQLRSKFSNIGDTEQATTRRPVPTRPISRFSSTTSATGSIAQYPMHRKVHDGKIPDVQATFRKTPTYSVKKPLPYKPVTGDKARGYKSAATLPSVAECPRITMSAESVATQISESWSCDKIENDDDDDDDDNDNDNATAIIMSAAEMRSQPRAFSACRRTPTRKLSINEVDQSQQLSRTFIPGIGNESPEYPKRRSSRPRSSSGGRKKHVQKASTIQSHSSPSEHSIGSKRHEGHHMSEQEQRQPMHSEQPTSGGAECAPRHCRKTPDNIPVREQKHPNETETSAMSSASQESIQTYKSYPRSVHCMSRIPTPTTSMCTLVAETADRLERCVIAGKRRKSKPVAVAPSGPAGHCKKSKLPRPTLRPPMRYTGSARSVPSKCSSSNSLRSEFNYARPMPIERIPFSKFGLECVVPLFKREVSATSVDAYSITGVTGQCKRSLPLSKSVPNDLWETISGSTKPWVIARAEYHDGVSKCEIKIISSIVARPMSDASTQTHKSVSYKSENSRQSKEHKRTGKSAAKNRKKNTAETADDDNDDSNLLTKLVQLLFLQNQLDSEKSDTNNSSAGINSQNQHQDWAFNRVATKKSYSNPTSLAPVASATVIYPQAQARARSSSSVPVHSKSLLHFLRKQKEEYGNPYPVASAEQPPVPTPTSTITPRARVYRMSPSAIQVVNSRTQSNTVVSGRASLPSVSSSNWANDVIENASVFPKKYQSPAWPYRGTTSQLDNYLNEKFQSNYGSPRHNYYENRRPAVSAYTGQMPRRA